MTLLSMAGKGINPPESNSSTFDSSSDSTSNYTTRPSVVRSSSYTSTRASSSQAQLFDKFAELRDAIYFSAPAAGFILSADEKFAYPNYRAGQPPAEPVEIDDVEEFFKTWDCWDGTFSRRLDVTEYPSIRLSRSRKPFRGMRVGTQTETGEKTLFEARGDLIYAPKTHQYLGGVVWLTELGNFEDIQRHEQEQALKSFETICDSLPHSKFLIYKNSSKSKLFICFTNNREVVWTATPDGQIDYFSRSWYEKSGRTPENSLGHRWREGIHPDDMGETWLAFGKAMGSGREVETEFRYRRADGVWRWMEVGTLLFHFRFSAWFTVYYRHVQNLR